MGVPEDGHGFDYGFKLKKVCASYMATLTGCYMMLCLDWLLCSLQRREEDPPLVSQRNDLPEDVFLMVTQEHWEDKIQADIPFTPSSSVGGLWNPLGENSAASFSRQMSSSMGRSTTEGGMGATTEASPDVSLFSIDNYDLIYTRWEDDIIFDSDAAQKIPRPTVAQIDPNDPKFIIGIPEEPPQTLPGDKDARKVRA